MRILLVEDNIRLSEAIAESFYKNGMEVDAVATGEDALSVVGVQPYDAMVLDLGLPDMDGMDVLQRLRGHNNPLPVLILTARGALSDKVSGLNGGADDYLAKPFEVDELIARVRALLRRPAQAVDSVITLNNLTFDTLNRQTLIGGKTVSLSRRETDLLEQLIRSLDKIVTKRSIELRLYSHGETGSENAVEVLVHRLRKKLIDNTAAIEIHTLKGIGYMMTGVGV